MKNTIFYIIICSLLAFTSCKSSVYDQESGLAIYLSMPGSDKSGEITIRIFNSEETLTKEINFSSEKDLNNTFLDLPSGDYTIVATSKTQDIFSVNKITGETTLHNLCMILKNPSSSPEYAFYGVKQITVESEKFITTQIMMHRIFAEINITLNNLPENITKVSAEVTNAATGFYPCLCKLTSDTVTVQLGEANVENGTAVIPARRLMPVINSVLTKAENYNYATGTQILFKFYKKDGTSTESKAQLPTIENGGIYSPEFDFNDSMPELVLDVHIIDWEEKNGGEYRILESTE